MRRGAAVMAALVAGAVLTVPPDPPAHAGDRSGRYRATIQRTAYGVAHITAADWGSLGFGQLRAAREGPPALTGHEAQVSFRNSRSISSTG